MPAYNVSPFRQFTQSVTAPVRSALRGLTQPTSDDVWDARLKGFVGGAGEGLLDFLTPSETEVMPDPTAGLAPVAGAMATKSLPTVSKEAYEAVKGLKGLYSRLTDTMVQRMPERAFPSKIAALAKSGSSAEEQSVRKFGDFLAGRDPNKVVEKADVLAHLEANPIELQAKTYRPASEAHKAWQQRVEDLEGMFQDQYGAGWQNRLTGNQLDEWSQLQNAQPSMFGRPGEDVRYREYQVPGGENYQEALIKSPVEVEESVLSLPDVDVYNSPHWPDDPNVLVHTRANDRSLIAPVRNPEYYALARQIDEGDAHLPLEEAEARYYRLQDELSRTPKEFPPQGGKGRFIEEIQSDLHQLGEKVGYSPEEHEAIQASNVTKMRALQDRIDEIKRQLTRWDDASQSWIDHPANPEGRAELDELQKQFSKMASEYDQYSVQGPVPDLPFKESHVDLALKQQLLEAADDPELEWLGISGPQTQIDRFPDENNVKGMLYHYGQEYPAKLAKLLKPFGGTVERTTLPRTEAPAGFLNNGGDIFPIEQSGQKGTKVASVWPRVPDNWTGLNPGSYNASKIIDALNNQVSQGIMPPGPEISMARLTPEMKEQIKRVGFPAMAALLGLRGAFSGEER